MIKKVIIILILLLLPIVIYMVYVKPKTELVDALCDDVKPNVLVENSDQLQLISENITLEQGSNNFEMSDWVVALQGRTFICLSEEDGSMLSAEDDLVGLNVDGVKHSGESVNFNELAWHAIDIGNRGEAVCLQLESDHLSKGERFVEITMNVMSNLHVDKIYWFSEGYWSTKCKAQ